MEMLPTIRHVPLITDQILVIVFLVLLLVHILLFAHIGALFTTGMRSPVLIKAGNLTTPACTPLASSLVSTIY